jgi:hypothetical protein
MDLQSHLLQLLAKLRDRNLAQPGAQRFRNRSAISEGTHYDKLLVGLLAHAYRPIAFDVFDIVTTTNGGKIDYRRQLRIDGHHTCESLDAIVDPLTMFPDEALHDQRRCAQWRDDLNATARIHSHR